MDWRRGTTLFIALVLLNICGRTLGQNRPREATTEAGGRDPGRNPRQTTAGSQGNRNPPPTTAGSQGNRNPPPTTTGSQGSRNPPRTTAGTRTGETNVGGSSDGVKRLTTEERRKKFIDSLWDEDTKELNDAKLDEAVKSRQLKGIVEKYTELRSMCESKETMMTRKACLLLSDRKCWTGFRISEVSDIAKAIDPPCPGSVIREGSVFVNQLARSFMYYGNLLPTLKANLGLLSYMCSMGDLVQIRLSMILVNTEGVTLEDLMTLLKAAPCKKKLSDTYDALAKKLDEKEGRTVSDVDRATAAVDEGATPDRKMVRKATDIATKKKLSEAVLTEEKEKMQKKRREKTAGSRTVTEAMKDKKKAKKCDKDTRDIVNALLSNAEADHVSLVLTSSYKTCGCVDPAVLETIPEATLCGITDKLMCRSSVVNAFAAKCPSAKLVCAASLEKIRRDYEAMGTATPGNAADFIKPYCKCDYLSRPKKIELVKILQEAWPSDTKFGEADLPTMDKVACLLLMLPKYSKIHVQALADSGESTCPVYEARGRAPTLNMDPDKLKVALDECQEACAEMPCACGNLFRALNISQLESTDAIKECPEVVCPVLTPQNRVDYLKLFQGEITTLDRGTLVGLFLCLIHDDEFRESVKENAPQELGQAVVGAIEETIMLQARCEGQGCIKEDASAMKNKVRDVLKNLIQTRKENPAPDRILAADPGEKRKKRAVTETTCDDISREMPYLAELSTLADSVFATDSTCFQALGEGTGYTDQQLTDAIAALKRVHGEDVSAWSTQILENAGVLSFGLSVDDIAKLSLDNDDILTSIASPIDNMPARDKEVAMYNRWKDAKQVTSTADVMGDQLADLGSITCGMPVADIEGLTAAEVKKAVGSLSQYDCMHRTEDEWRALVAKIKEAYDSSMDTYVPDIIEELGTLFARIVDPTMMADLTDSQLDAITPDIMEMFSVTVLEAFPAGLVDELTTAQKESLSEAQSAALPAIPTTTVGGTGNTDGGTDGTTDDTGVTDGGTDGTKDDTGGTDGGTDGTKDDTGGTDGGTDGTKDDTGGTDGGTDGTKDDTGGTDGGTDGTKDDTGGTDGGTDGTKDDTGGTDGGTDGTKDDTGGTDGGTDGTKDDTGGTDGGTDGTKDDTGGTDGGTDGTKDDTGGTDGGTDGTKDDTGGTDGGTDGTKDETGGTDGGTGGIGGGMENQFDDIVQTLMKFKKEAKELVSKEQLGTFLQESSPLDSAVTFRKAMEKVDVPIKDLPADAIGQLCAQGDRTPAANSLISVFMHRNIGKAAKDMSPDDVARMICGLDRMELSTLGATATKNLIASDNFKPNPQTAMKLQKPISNMMKETSAAIVKDNFVSAGMKLCCLIPLNIFKTALTKLDLTKATLAATYGGADFKCTPPQIELMLNRILTVADWTSLSVEDWLVKVNEIPANMRHAMAAKYLEPILAKATREQLTKISEALMGHGETMMRMLMPKHMYKMLGKKGSCDEYLPLDPKIVLLQNALVNLVMDWSKEDSDMTNALYMMRALPPAAIKGAVLDKLCAEAHMYYYLHKEQCYQLYEGCKSTWGPVLDNTDKYGAAILCMSQADAAAVKFASIEALADAGHYLMEKAVQSDTHISRSILTEGAKKATALLNTVEGKADVNADNSKLCGFGIMAKFGGQAMADLLKKTLTNSNKLLELCMCMACYDNTDMALSELAPFTSICIDAVTTEKLPILLLTCPGIQMSTGVLSAISKEALAKLTNDELEELMGEGPKLYMKQSTRDHMLKAFQDIFGKDDNYTKTELVTAGLLLADFTEADWMKVETKEMCNLLEFVQPQFKQAARIASQLSRNGFSATAAVLEAKKKVAIAQQKLKDADKTGVCDPTISTTPNRKRRSTTTGTTCSDLQMKGLFNLGKQGTDLSGLSSEEFLECQSALGALSEEEKLTGGQLSVLASKAVAAYGGVASWSMAIINSLGSIVSGLSKADLEKLVLESSSDFLDLGVDGVWDTIKLQTMAQRYIKQFKDNNVSALTGMYDLKILGHFVCGFGTDDIAQIPADEYCDAAIVIGEQRCEEAVLAEWSKKAKDCFGNDVSTWEIHELASFGNLLGGLDKTDIMKIPAGHIPTLAPEALRRVPASAFSGLTAEQLGKLDLTQLSQVTVEQLDAMDSTKSAMLKERWALYEADMGQPTSDDPQNGAAQKKNGCGLKEASTMLLITTLMAACLRI